MRNGLRESAASSAAYLIKKTIPELTNESSPIGLVLGTGWDVLKIDKAVEIPFLDIPGFNKLEDIPGHARKLVFGEIAGKQVLVLRGRVHMNEAPNDPDVPKMVRLQTEMLFKLGVKTIIVTSAVGRLKGDLDVGGVAIINGFITLYAPEMPLWAGEFCSPEDSICEELKKIASRAGGDRLITQSVGHVMVRGPFFEGRNYDKSLLAASGASVVGMSMLPEACIASLYGARFLGLGFVTNDAVTAHSHEENLKQAKIASVHLGQYLTDIVEQL